MSASIPAYVTSFIEKHSPIISANAYRIEFYQGEDLYGLDMCIDLCGRLKSDYPQVGFLCCLPSIGHQSYFETLKDRIMNSKIGSNFLFVTEENMALIPILSKSDVFVRPTNTDGDALSVRESIYVGTPVIASDVVPRPSEVVLFQNRNDFDFYHKVKDVLQNPKPLTVSQHRQSTNKLSFADAIWDIYQNI